MKNYLLPMYFFYYFSFVKYIFFIIKPLKLKSFLRCCHGFARILGAWFCFSRFFSYFSEKYSQWHGGTPKARAPGEYAPIPCGKYAKTNIIFLSVLICFKNNKCFIYAFLFFVIFCRFL